jgi:glycosyltransferase involved in cell wall biosynthesis
MSKILFYINTIGHGGAERVIINLANHFNAKGHEVLLVTSNRLNEEYPYDHSIIRVNLNESNIKKRITKNIYLILKLRKIIKDRNPDIIISFMAEANIRSLISTTWTKTKTIISIRNDPNMEYKNIIIRVFAQILYRKANGIVFQTKDVQEWFSRRLQDKSRIILNPVDTKFLTINYNGGRKNVITVGRLTDQKNHVLLINAFTAIANCVDDNLLIYGEGPLRSKLESLIIGNGMTNRIFLMGKTTDVANQIKGAKLFVLSSNYEGLPNALMEAMALGIPCISTNCSGGGPKYLLGSNSNEYLFKTGDSQALQSILIQTLNNSQKLLEMSNFVKERAQEFEPKLIFEYWTNYVDEIIDNKSNIINKE